MLPPVPHAAITFNPETSKYGFSVWMPGKRPHYEMLDVFNTSQDARNWIDPQHEREWEEPEAHGVTVAISRGFKAGSVPTRV